MIARNKRSYGVLLPHFGPYATPERLVKGSQRLEELGFDAVWVRDHIVFHPHSYEPSDLTHVEPFVTLSAISSVTKRITLGTATLIPYRHPIDGALSLGSLDYFAKDRVIAGWGLGANDSEFEAIGKGGWDRREVIEEQVRAIKELLTGREIDHDGKYYQYNHVQIKPVPGPGRQIPMWYGGGSKAAARRAVEYCEGWMHGRMPRRDTQERIQRMERLAGEAGKERPIACVLPYVSPGKTVEEATKAFDLAELGGACERQYVLPPSGKFETLADMDGAAIAGPAEVIAEEFNKFHEIGVEHIVFDFRTSFDKFEECYEYVGAEVLPLLRGKYGLLSEKVA